MKYILTFLLSVSFFVGCAARAPQSTVVSPQLPDWYMDQEAVFPLSEYIVGRGTAQRDSLAAEQRAIARMIGFFETRYEFIQQMTVNMAEDASGVSKDLSISELHSSQSGGDFFDVRTRSFYHTATGQWEAIAYMNKRAALQRYALKINNNMSGINNAMQRIQRTAKPLHICNVINETIPLAEETSNYILMATIIDEASQVRYMRERNQINQLYLTNIELCQSLSFLMESVEGDAADGLIKNTIQSIMRRGGYIFNQTPTYTVKANISHFEEERPAVKYNITSSIDIQIIRNNTVVDRYTKQYPRVGETVSRDRAFRQSYFQIVDDLEKNLLPFFTQ
jgi:hypothetical protein